MTTAGGWRPTLGRDMLIAGPDGVISTAEALTRFVPRTLANDFNGLVMDLRQAAAEPL